MATDKLWSLKVWLNLRRKLSRVSLLLDVLAAIPAGIAGSLFYLLKRIGLRGMPLTRRVLDAVGIWPVRRHYYEPYFDQRMLRRPLDEPRGLPGLDLHSERAVALVRALGRYGAEPLVGPVEGDLSYGPDNGTYGLADAALLYALVRHLKPARVFEVGSGNSTLVVLKALAANRAAGHPCTHLCIEPFEMPWLDRTSARIKRAMIEDVEASFFDEMEDADMLLIDNSHMIRPQGDVLTVVQSILPRLAPGVMVHIHDLFTPRDYPERWVVRDRLMWNEQYLVEAFMTCNSVFETVIPSNHIYTDFREVFDSLRPELASTHSQIPTSYWIRRKPVVADRVFVPR